MDLFIQKLSPNAKLPSRAHSSAGFDLFSAVRVIIKPGETRKVPLGIKAAFDEGYVALIWDRSSMAVKGIHCFAGVIDHDFRGEWEIVLHNHKDQDSFIEVGQKVAQVLFQQVFAPNIILCDKLPESARGTGGWGSTGAY